MANDIVDNMYLPEDEDLGIFLQQDDFLDKDIRPVTEIEDQRSNNSTLVMGQDFTVTIY